MSIIDYNNNNNNNNSSTRVLVSVKGHPYPRDDFFAMFEAMNGIAYTAVEQPASQLFFTCEHSRDYEAIVVYDMPGINFSTQPPVLVPPPESYTRGFLELLQAGKGIVFLHHAIAGWPLWPQYANIVGGRFWYLPGEHGGRQYADSGYRHDAQHRVQVLTEHPVTEGVDASFELTDELYLYDVFEESVIPLLASDFQFQQDQFYSAKEAVSGHMYSRENWARTGGSRLVGWVKSYANSPIVYLQMGDGRNAYQNPNVARLLENAIRWVSSEEASLWARQRAEP